MSKGLTRSLARGATVKQAITKLRIPVKNLAVSVVGASGVGFGFVAISGLPQGNLFLVGAVSYLRFNKNGAAALQDAFDGDYSIGTVGTVDVDVADPDEATIIPSTAMGAATAGLSPVIRGAMTLALQGLPIDNTDSSKSVILNVLIDDANISGTAAMLVDGIVELAFVVLGDD
jgi:hypothetical protein